MLATYKAGPANVLEPGVWPPGFLTDPPRAPRPEAEAAPEPDSGTARAHGTPTVVATPPDEEPPCTPPAAAARPAKTPPSRGKAKARAAELWGLQSPRRRGRVAAKAAVLKATTQKSKQLQHIKGSVRWKLFCEQPTKEQTSFLAMARQERRRKQEAGEVERPRTRKGTFAKRPIADEFNPAQGPELATPKKKKEKYEPASGMKSRHLR